MSANQQVRPTEFFSRHPVFYTGAVERDTMVAERPKVEQAIQAVCGRAGIQIRRVPGEHAGGNNRRDWRTLSLDDVRADPREVDQQLVPLLRADTAPARARSSPLGASASSTSVAVVSRPFFHCAPRRSSSSIS